MMHNVHLPRLNQSLRVAALALSLLACSVVRADASETPAPLNMYAPYTAEQVAKAATAAINGRPASIMHATAASAEQRHGYIVEYTRPSDGSLWRMQIAPDEHGGIRWRSWDKLATPQRWGRWRTHALDEKFRWYVDGNGVLVISGDLIGDSRYTLADF